MDVTLLTPNFQRLSEAGSLYGVPLGIASIGSGLRADGHSVELYDLSVQDKEVR